MRRILFAVAVLAFGSGCAKHDPDASPSCAAGSEPREGDCIALVPRCSGRAVGVAGACVPVGQTAADCATGFSFDEARGGCLPVLPTESCKAGTMAIPGETACRPVAPCAARFPTVAGSPVYVDASASGVADGTVDRPYRTITEGLARGVVVAVAAGRYEEVVTIEDGHEVIGACPDKVEIVGPTSSNWAVAMQRGATLRAVSVTGPKSGLGVCEGKLVVDRVRIHDTGGRGIELYACPTETELQVTDSLIERATDQGIFGVLGTGLVERTVVRDTTTTTDKRGVGVWWQWDKRAKGPQDLRVRASVIERNMSAGVNAISVPLLVEGSVLRATIPAGTGRNGRGILVESLPSGPLPSVVVRASLLADNIGEAFSMGVGEATLEAVVVSGTKTTGTGVLVREGGHAEVLRLVAFDNAGRGVMVAGGELRVRDSVFSATAQAAVAGQPFLTLGGRAYPTRLVVERVRIDGGIFGGIIAVNTETTISGVYIHDIRPHTLGFGDGIAVGNYEAAGAKVATTLEDVLVEGVSRAGLGLFGADATLKRTRLLCNAFDIDVEGGLTTGATGATTPPGTIADSGDVACGCGALTACTARSAGLVPIGL